MQSAYITIGGTGAVSTTGTGYRAPAGFTLTRTGTGTYSLVYASCTSIVLLPFVALSPTPTVFDVVVTAISPTAGTATIKTFNAAGSATDPASGDAIGFVLLSMPVSTSAGF